MDHSLQQQPPPATAAAAAAVIGDGIGAGGGDVSANEEVDTTARITAFRETRRLRRQRGTTIVFFLGFSVACVGLQWADIGRHHPLPFVPAENQWAVGYFFATTGTSLAFVAADHIEFEQLWGQLNIREFRTDVPTTCLTLTSKFAFIYTNSWQVPTLYKKYGWPATYMYVLGWAFPLVSLIMSLPKCRLNVFAPAVTKEKPFLQRKPTVCEWYCLYAGIDFLLYAVVDAEMWMRNQWSHDTAGEDGSQQYGRGSGDSSEGGLLGPNASPIIAIASSLFLGARYVNCWGVRAFDQDIQGHQRRTLLGSLWMQFNIHLGIVFLIRVAVMPATQELMGDDRDLMAQTMETAPPGKTRLNDRETMFLVGFNFVLVAGFTFRYRQHIYDFFVRRVNQRQRLVDGAFIAALLDYDEDDASKGTVNEEDEEAPKSGTSRTGSRKRDLIEESTQLIRRLPMCCVSLAMLSASPRDPTYDSAQSFALGESCGLGGVDFFVSHSWSDCPKQKFTQLCAIALDFYQQHGRPPTFWLDKCCIDQTNISRTLRCLPVMVQSCSRLLILCGDSYCQRLWCVWELYTWFAMSGADAAKRTTVANCCRPRRETARLEEIKQGLSVGATDVEALAALAASELNMEQARGDSMQDAAPEDQIDELHDDNRGAALLSAFDVKDAHCFSATDEAKLRRVIESESAETFNDAIREAGAALQSSTQHGTLRASRMQSLRSSTVANPLSTSEPGGNESALEKSLRSQFVALDYNCDGRLCRADLHTAFGGGSWFQETQLDELMQCIAVCKPRIEVNGNLSIGLAEFRSWMRRSRS
jgi:hypothetical protein